MNEETLKALKDTADKLRDAMLFHPKDFDEKTAWMFILTFIAESVQYELDRETTNKKVYT